jgi:hypothetical protein
MNGNVLRAFFENQVSVADLLEDLNGTRSALGADSVRHQMTDTDSEFLVTTNHLLKLCDAVLTDQIPPGHLEWIGFGLVASDHFEWDTDTIDGERVGDTVIDWASPSTNYRLTMDTVRKFRHRLITGENTFDKSDFGTAGMSPGRVVWEPNQNP